MVINTNLAAMVSQRNLAESTDNLQRALSRLSTGSKLVQPQDDAAGLAMAARLDARIKRIDATKSSLLNAVSYVQTKDGYLGKVQSALERMSEIATLASDGTKSADDVKLYVNEFNSLRDFIQLNIATRKFNGVALFDSDALEINTDEDGSDLGKIELHTTDLVTQGGSVDETALIAAGDNNSNSDDWITDGVAGNSSANPPVAAVPEKVNLLKVKESLDAVSEALKAVSSQRADLGADLSRLNISLDTLSVLKENVSAATSRIRDVDVAEESASYARYSILVQAGTAMLAQANVIPQTALRLLQ